MSRSLSNILFLLFLIAFYPGISQERLTHASWTELLKEHVTEKGVVDYKGFKKDEEKLTAYLKTLAEGPPASSWTRNQKMAFWINVYNAFTVKLIVENLPVKSIKDLGGSIYKVNTPWDIKFIKIGKKIYDLNNIEHKILRKKFKDPRIHFAVNCASVSCPKLRNEAYVGAGLNEQLDEQTKYFINNSGKNIIEKDKAQLSKLFSWYRMDFKDKDQTVIDFINGYSNKKIDVRAKISYLEYDWNLND